VLVVFEWIRTAAKSDISVLVLAHGPADSWPMIHELSRRSVAKFQALNCAALPDTLFESEIFTKKGAFTGCTTGSRAGSSWPTMAPCSSTKSATCRYRPGEVLRALEAALRTLGGNKSIAVDFRLISGQPPARQFVRDGRFARICTTERLRHLAAPLRERR
jgi:transcriptional regulator with PAS, ATPase and Fis domain